MDPQMGKHIQLADGIQTFTGRVIHPNTVSKNDIDLVDIAHALSNLCRFGGHCKFFYSVAQHCVHGAEWTFRDGQDYLSVKERSARAMCFLLHDASEAYLVDVPRPLKALMPEYVVLEKKLQSAVIRRFDMGVSCDRFLNHTKEVDNRMLTTEKRDIVTGDAEWECCKHYTPFDKIITYGWEPKHARICFENAFDTYSKGMQ